jgi:hypothetical protein
MGRSGYRGGLLPCHGHPTLPVQRMDLPYLVSQAEHGKPVVLPRGTARRKAGLWGGGYRRMEQAKAAL